jgi:hypothetical protein
VQCISAWLSNQEANNLTHSCPVCRSAASALLHNCTDETHDRHALQPDAGSGLRSSALSPDHRVRRRAYFQPMLVVEAVHAAVLRAQVIQHATARAPASASRPGADAHVKDASASAWPATVTRRAGAANLQAWLAREVQAVLADDTSEHALMVRVTTL